MFCNIMAINKLTSYFLALFLLCPASLYAASTQGNDSQDFSILKAEVESLKRQNETLTTELHKANEVSQSQQSQIDKLDAQLDSLDQVATDTRATINALSDSLQIKIADTNNALQSNTESLNKDIKDKANWGLWLLVALAAILAIVATILGLKLSRRGNQVEALSEKADKLNEEIVNRLSSEMTEMQSLSKSIGALASAGGSASDEQGLIKTLADRITFMEMTLYRMDDKVKGHKPLTKAIKQMKDNLRANGYELVDMLGKPYNEGMRVTANFIDDENLEEGQQIITAIIKPQINYKGQMIQAAQITVSQNI